MMFLLFLTHVWAADFELAPTQINFSKNAHDLKEQCLYIPYNYILEVEEFRLLHDEAARKGLIDDPILRAKIKTKILHLEALAKPEFNSRSIITIIHWELPKKRFMWPDEYKKYKEEVQHGDMTHFREYHAGPLEKITSIDLQRVNYIGNVEPNLGRNLNVLREEFKISFSYRTELSLLEYCQLLHTLKLDLNLNLFSRLTEPASNATYSIQLKMEP